MLLYPFQELFCTTVLYWLQLHWLNHYYIGPELLMDDRVTITYIPLWLLNSG